MTKISVDRLMRRAKASALKGAVDEAREAYRMILDRFPNNARAAKALAALDSGTSGSGSGSDPAIGDAVQQLLGLEKLGKFDLAAAKAEELTAKAPGSVDLWKRMALINHRIGRIDKMELALRKACALRPDDASLHTNLGIALHLQGRNEDAIPFFQESLRLKPDNAVAHNSLATALVALGKREEAAKCFLQATRCKPDYVEAWNNLGRICIELGKYQEALPCFRKVLELAPGSGDVHRDIGVALKALGRDEEAVAALRMAISIAPGDAQAHFSLGSLLSKAGKDADALHCFNEAIRLEPRNHMAHFNMGVALFGEGRPDEAIESYVKAVQLRPDFAEGYVNLGTVYQAKAQLDAALASFDRALELRPDMSEAFAGRGEAQRQQGKLDEALTSLEAAVKLAPDNDLLRFQKIDLQAHMADWTEFSDIARQCETLGTQNTAITPFRALAIEDNPARQLARSRLQAKAVDRFVRPPLPAWKKQPGERIRVGYFSADMREHPMAFILTGHLAGHDRDRFEVFVFSFAPPDRSTTREKAQNAVEHFIDISDIDDRAIVEMVREKRLDIAIDLMGYTKYCRPELFARRLAPVQINYLGFPSTMGADFIDYILADNILIPDEQRRNYSERLLAMPHTYFPYDRDQKISDKQTTRADFGLPEDALVFCCFNQIYKIGPREFDIWMRLIRKVDDSVFWLPPMNRWVVENLRKEAESRGVDPARLVFAERLTHEEHLARYRHADLFLDTFNCNAHTTAADALWGGVPIVTKIGRQFAARVCASILTAAGLPEMITKSEAEYEQLALDLATDRERLAGIRAKLAGNRLAKPMFDTPRFTRDLESQLETVFAISQKELAGTSAV